MANDYHLSTEHFHPHRKFQSTSIVSESMILNLVNKPSSVSYWLFIRGRFLNLSMPQLPHL